MSDSSESHGTHDLNAPSDPTALAKELIERFAAVVADEADEYAADAAEAIEGGERPDLWEREVTIPVHWTSSAATLLQALLEEALRPFADKSKAFDDAADKMGFVRPDDRYRPKTSFTHADLRAARNALEPRP